MRTWLLIELCRFAFWCQLNPWEGEAESIGWLYEQVFKPELSGGFERVIDYGNNN